MSNPEPLQIIDVSLVTLIASLTAAGDLKLVYDGEDLADYDDAIEVINDNLPVTVEILDFVDGSTSWEMSASHLEATTVYWSQTATGCDYDWSQTSGQVEVDVEAQAGTQTESKPILIKVRPRTEQ